MLDLYRRCIIQVDWDHKITPEMLGRYSTGTDDHRSGQADHIRLGATARESALPECTPALFSTVLAHCGMSSSPFTSPRYRRSALSFSTEGRERGNREKTHQSEKTDEGADEYPEPFLADAFPPEPALRPELQEPHPASQERPVSLERRTSKEDGAGKRLVEQFYSTELPKFNRRPSAFGRPFARFGARARAPTDAHADSEYLQPAHVAVGDEKFKELVQKGQLKYVALDREVAATQTWVEQLVAVEVQRDEVDPMVAAVEAAARAMARPPRAASDAAATSNGELARVSEHLQQLRHESVRVRQELLLAAARELQAQASEALRTSVAKLDALEATLAGLEARFARARSTMVGARELLGAGFDAKVAMLEEVARRFAEHDLLHRKRRLRQLVSALGVAVVVAAVGIVFWRAR